MASFRISSSVGRRPRAAALVALLLLTLVVAGVLAYQAQDAARSHRAAVENTLRDYSAFAAWEFSRRAREQVFVSVHQTMHPLFEPGSHTIVRPELPDIAEFEDLRDPETQACGALDAIDYYFRLDLPSRAISTSGRGPAGAEAAWLADTIAADIATIERRSGPYEAVIFGDVEGNTRAVAYTVNTDGHAEAVVVHGFGTSAAAFASLCEQVFGIRPLLPPSLTGGAPNDSILSVVVTTADGGPICGSGALETAIFAAADTLDVTNGRLVVQAALRPDAAESLLIGGLPASRLPLLLGLLLLTAGLVAVALVQLRREYELARLRDEFVSGVSHELRTPLAQIRMFVETLLLGRVRSDLERRRSLEIIDREARRLGQLVENVLQFSRSERGRDRLAPEPTPLGPLVREVAEAFQPLARARSVDLRANVGDDVAAEVDRGAVRQMLLNLLDNAVKYGPPGQTVTISAAAERDRIRLCVDDQGPGVPVADRERVWDSFSRLERDVEAAVAGSGIGLAVVRELAGLHAGRTWVETAPGGGARFVIELPRSGDLAVVPVGADSAEHDDAARREERRREVVA